MIGPLAGTVWAVMMACHSAVVFCKDNDLGCRVPRSSTPRKLLWSREGWGVSLEHQAPTCAMSLSCWLGAGTWDMVKSVAVGRAEERYSQVV